MHSYDSNDAWMTQNAIQQQQAHIDMWGMLSFWNQCRTNRRLDATNNEIRQTNVLLEKIRRQMLTPAQRAAEDAERKAKLAAEKARRKAEAKATLVVMLVLAAIFSIGGLWNSVSSAASEASRTRPVTPVEPAPVQQIESVSPQQTTLELPQTGEVFTPRPTPSDHIELADVAPAPRAQLVHARHHHRIDP
jgi:hypothetical protein